MIHHYPRPEILDQIPLHRHTVIEASAGTGKTYTIEHLVIELLLKTKSRLENILVLTFTEMAAGELRSRIRGMMERMLQADHPRRPSPASWRLDAHARKSLRHALNNFDIAPIHTIHGFLQRVLNDYAFSSNRLFAHKIINDGVLFSSVMHHVLRTKIPQQAHLQQFVSAWLSHRDITELDDLLYKLYDKRGAIRPQFDHANFCSRLEQAAATLLQNGVEDDLRTQLRAHKVHGASVNAILRRMPILRKTLRQFLDTGNPYLAVITIDRDTRVAFRKYLSAIPLHDGVFQAIRNLFAGWPGMSAIAANLFLPLVREGMHAEKRKNGFIDFHDMIRLTWDALEGPGGGSMLRALRGRFHFAMLDEFQDTDDLQWKIFHRIFLESGGQNILYVIGDPKQAIYGFRGADVHTYLHAKKQIAGTSSPVVRLNKNYRSTSLMIDALNLLFSASADRPFFQGDIRYDEPVQCGNTRFAATDAHGRALAPIHIFSIQTDVPPVNIRAIKTCLAQRIAREIRQIMEEAILCRDAALQRRVSYQDIFVLTRTTRESHEIAASLTAAAIPYAFYKQDGLFETDEAAHVLHLLQAIRDPDRPAARMQAWLTPFFAVPINSLAACRDLARNHPLVAPFYRWRELADGRRYRELFTDIPRHTGIFLREIFCKENERGLTNYQHLFEILLEETTANRSDITGLIRMMQNRKAQGALLAEEGSDIQRLETDRRAVQIMTMHKSKGLESAVVFLYGGFLKKTGREDYVQYHAGPDTVLYLGDTEEMQDRIRTEQTMEAQRLLYVAATRAKCRLYLPYIRTQKDPSGTDREDYVCKQAFTYDYRVMNDRLDALLSQLQNDPAPHLFRVEECHAPVPETAPESRRHLHVLQDWRPACMDRNDHEKFRTLKTRHAPFVVTSYTRLHQRHRTAPIHVEEFREEIDELPADILDPDIPRGADFGSYIHDILAQLPFRSLDGRIDLRTWRRQDAIVRLFQDIGMRHAMSPDHTLYSQQIIHHALTTPIPLSDGTTLPCLWQCHDNLREVEFLFPFPERQHVRLNDQDERPFVIHRGYVTGYIDFLFEHQEKIYFLDWKTNVLPDYAPDTVRDHVHAHYDLQSRLYTLAVVKMLQVHDERSYQERFGGYLYLFLRKLTGQGHGCFFAKPSWNLLLRYEEELLRMQPDTRHP